MQNLILLTTYFAFLLSEILLNRFLRSKSTDKQGMDKNSIKLIWITIFVAITVAVYVSKTVYVLISFNPIILYVGAVLVFVGIIIRLFAVFSLGRFFTVDITIRQEHQLKEDGLYKYIRHPSYSAALLSFIGMGFTFNNWLSVCLLVVPILTVFIIRINVEEKMLIQHFGIAYTEYKKRTKALIPFIY